MSIHAHTELLGAVVDQLPLGVIIVEAPSGRILHTNREMEVICGQPMPEGEPCTSCSSLIGYHLDGTAMRPEEWPVCRALKGERIDSEELRIQRPDRTWRNVRINAGPIRNGSDEIRAAVVTAQDVTGQRLAESQLRLLEHAVANLNDGIMITEAEPLHEPGPRILFVNRAFSQITGYSPEEVLGRSPRFLHGPKTSRETREKIRAALLAGEPVRAELLNYRKDGAEFWTEMQITPLRDSTGRITHFVAVERDATARNLEQLIVEAAKRRLDEAQALAHVGSWEWDVIEDRAYWSDEMYRICGMTAGETPIRRLSFLQMVHPDDQAALHARVDHALATGEPIDASFRLIRPDGSVRHLHSRARLIKDPHGQPLRLVGAAQDVTEQVEAQKAKVQAEKLEAANKELEAFSYSVSHDLRAPARRMIAYAQILNEPQNLSTLNEESRACVEGIRNCSKRMSDLIEDMLSLAQVARGVLKREHCDITAMAQAIVGELSTTDPQRQVNVEIAPHLTAHADARLTQILLHNLLANAWKFSRHNPQARIEVGRREGGPPSVLFVRDNGVGFEPAYAHHLFKPFQRLHAITEFEGTGIGLATVHRIVTRHNGRVWAEAVLNQGATFYFTLEE